MDKGRDASGTNLKQVEKVDLNFYGNFVDVKSESLGKMGFNNQYIYDDSSQSMSNRQEDQCCKKKPHEMSFKERMQQVLFEDREERRKASKP